MTKRVVAAGWLLLTCCVSCGGNTLTTKPDPTATTAGASSMPDLSNQAGEHPGQPLSCDGPQPACLQRCDSLDLVEAECVDLQYRCPEGWLDLDSCSRTACAMRSQTCCSPTGQVTLPTCAADGSIGACPEGFAQQGTCLPEGLGIQSCLELKNGDACADQELLCYTGKCSYNCYCKPDDSGRLSWQCRVLPC